ncbi:YadA-like family protein [Burkholderia pseudomultivorans]|uniref:YadA-like family protein n=2 Tax=Burkholderia cepacia complex TaxID=87882 RepID=UPI002876D10C|nr:YadA-like family protein [Burkholderia pseudomultivorans]MDS0790677.1 YadA-like family protein [Burkholderia pseudomultivorans]
MNKTYRTVWNATTGTWTAAAETARTRTKSKSNTAMRSSVTAAVAVMAGVGGGAVSMDAMAQATTGGGLNLCSNTTAANGVRYGQTFGALSNTVNANCAPINTSLPSYQGHAPSFILANNAGTNGAAGLTPTASVMGSTDGHLVLYGQNGVHVSGPADFDNNVNMTNHRITGLATGTAGTDAVNVNQLNAAISAAATASNPYVAISTGTYATATAASAGGSATAVGANARATGTSAVALGGNTSATGQNAVALGTLSRATGSETVAVGVSANAAGTNSTALGRLAAAVGNNSLAAGYGAQANGIGSIAVGSSANVAASSTGSLALGQGAAVTRTGADSSNMIAIGTNARAGDAGAGVSTGAIAIGSGANAGGNGSIMIGTNAMHSGSNATVVGANSSAMGGGAGTVLGSNSSAAGSASVVLGSGATASGANSVALGTGSIANADNTVSVGSATTQRRITNLAAGMANTDAVNLGQMNEALSTKVANTYIQIDTRNGTAAAQAGAGSLAIGTNTSAAGSYATALGNSALASGNNSTAIGFQSSSAGGAAVAIGSGANAGGLHGVALGVNAQATHADSVALGAASVTDRNNSVSVGSSMLQRQITNVAAGTQRTDAVNVGQLSGVTRALGGGAAIDGSGNVTQPTYKVAGTDYHNVGDALDALAANGGSDPNAVTYDDATKDSVTLGGAGATTPVALHNVADGVLSATSKDAVNGSQLFATNQDLGNLKDALKDGGVIDPMTGESRAVVYDGATKDTVTLKGADGTTLSNVKAGVADMDAVNVSQLKDAGLIDPSTGKSIAAVTYDRHADGTANYGSVTLGNGTGPTQIKNVADAMDDSDALNLGQLKNAGLVGDDGSGKLTSLAVTYDSAAKDAVTLGGAGATTPVALKNVADGVDRHDAINLGQLQDAGLVAPVDPTNPGAGLTSLAVTYDSTAKDKVTLAGTDGTTLSNLKAGVADMDAVNVSQLKGSGLIGDDGKSIAAVTYDRHADGTPNYGSVTLGNGTGPTQIKNVADATDDSDALNLGQLKNAGLVGDDGSGKLTSMAVVYDGAARDKVTLAGTDGTTLSNVKAGVADTDAVNVSQLKGSGLIGDDGKSIAAVTYDRNTDGTPNYGSVTLGGAGAATPVALKNVATGVDGTDAVNVNQLNTGLSDLEDRLSGADLRFVKVNADPVSGTPAIASGALAVAIGAGAQGAGANSLALGSGARVTGNGSVAIGYNSVANQNNVVSVGAVGQERRIVNVADGDVAFQSTDAINGGQLYAALNNLSTSVTSKTQQAIDSFSSEIDKKTKAAIDEVNSRSMQPMDVTDPLVAVEGLQGNNLASLNGADPATSTAAAIGTSSVASGGNAVAVGLQSIAGSNNSVAIGSFAGTGAGQDYSVAVGSNVQTNGMQAVALGANTQANGDYALAIGNNGAQAIGDSSIALGNAANVRAGATNAIAIGTGANIARSVEGAMALGANATAAAANSIALGADSFSNRANALSVGRAGAERQIVNVAAGTQATDAVNVSQLTGLANALGGHAAVGVDGSITQPTYNVDGSDYHNVGDALDALASRSAGDPNAVAYDSAAKDTVTLGGAGATTPVALKNVADAKDDHDALNLGQLKNAGLVGDDGTGNLTSLAVTYDGAAKDAVTLGGTGATAPVALKNVADGVDRHDAINLGQLQDAGLVAPVDPTNPGAGLTSLAVTYDGVAKDTVTLAGADGTTLSNVKAGVADMDAVNVSQLKDAGLIDPSTGKSIAAVTYDRNADGTPNYGSVTLGNGTGPTQIKNVADATEDGDALNLGQLKNAGLVGEDTSGKLTSLAVTYDGASKDSVTLGGAGATTSVALHNVADGVLSATSKDAVNGSQLFATNTRVGDLEDSLKDGGVIDPATGKSLAVVYDSAAKNSVTLGNAGAPVTVSNVARGTAGTDAVNVDQLTDAIRDVTVSPNPLAVSYDTIAKDSVTLGGASATAPVALKNVADGVDRHDAINVGQLQDAGLVAPVDPTNPGAGLTSLAVAYDGVAKDTVTLKGADGTTLSNVKAGVADMDAVNVSQLKDSGLIGDDGKSIAAVTYDRHADGTPNYGSVTLGNGTGPTQIKNVADATDDGDALNLGQLKNAGLVGEDASGKLTSLAVTYDGASKDSVTLGGAGATTPVALHNVADGVLSATSKDAVNGSQLLATNTRVGDLEDSLKDGGVIDPATGESLAVVYDSAAKNSVTLGNAGVPVAIHNVAAGAVSSTSNDAINGSQLFNVSKSVADKIGGGAGVGADGSITDPTYSVGGQDYHSVGDALDALDKSSGGNPLAVAYDSASKDTVTLAGADGTTITNVKAGAVTAASTDAINGSQLHATAQSVADSLGGGSTVDADGKVTNPSYSLADPADASKSKSYNNVGDALANLDGRTSTNTENITVINKQLADSGLVDPVTGQSIAAVTYDRNADGTPNLGSVTLGGAGATAPVALKNVADGVDRHDAINVGQLQDAGLVAPVDPTNPGAGLTSLAVAYDGVAKDTVTLKGADGTTLSNVKAGVADMDAVNVSQLKDAGLIDPSTGKSIAAVTYDRNADGTPNYGSVTLGNGTGPTQLKNVADATDDGDALNLGQLKNAGLVGEDTSGKLTSLAVTYDGASKDSVTLGGAGATTPVALKNVADGVDRHDAINLGQLQDAGLVAPVDPTNPGAGLTSLAVAYDDASKDVVTLKGADGTTLTNVKAGAVTATSTDAINGSQLHATAQSVADSLGGGSTVDADGKVTNPSYSLADPADASKSKSYNNVGDALANLDGRTSTNTENITVINKQLADSGLVDPVTGQSLAAVTYDRNADGTPNLGSVTLGGAGATAPVALKNVADGVDAHDAVNLGQLQTAGLVAPVDPTNPGAGLTSLAVTYDKHADGSANFDQITLKGANGSTLTNVKAGAVNATSMDAVNGAQLYGASKSTADALGGGATVDANGNVTNPTYTVNNKTYNNVGDAIENISNSLVHGSIGLVQQDEDTREITVAKDTDGTTVNFTGTAGDRVLTGVGAGAVSATSNDAINGSQLHGTAQSVADVIGGGTTVDADGKLADTSIEVNGNKYKTVAEAVQAAAQYGATDSLAVRYDLNKDGTPNYGSVTLGGTGAAPVRLTNVADGVNQYDAVNYGQLSELSDRIGGLDDRVGALEQNPGTGNPNPGDGGSGNDYFAGTDIGSTGTTPANAGDGTGNTAAGSNATIATGVSNATVIGSGAGASKDGGVAIGSNAASAAEGAVAIGRGSDASGSQSTAIGDGAKASGSNSVAVGAGSVATEANTVSFGNGTDDGNRRLTNIKDGINESDAATKGQLDRAVGGMQGQINDLSRNAYSGIAAATALTMIPGVDPGKTLSFGVGGATYRGYQAVAFGGEARITQNLKMKAGVGLSSGGNTVGVGASYQW